MLSIHGRALRFCDGLPRREFLRVGGLGALGLSLPQLLRAQTAQAGSAKAASGGTFGQAKHCILMHLFGASPHQDTFDLKPEAPVEVRGEFMPIPTNVPGISISDHLPLLSQHADKYTIVRSVNHKEADHQAAFHDRAREVFEVQGIGFLVRLKKELPWERFDQWISEEVLAWLEEIEPGFQAWARGPAP